MRRIIVIYSILTVLVLGFCNDIVAQQRSEYVDKIELISLTNSYNTKENIIVEDGESHLYFEFTKPEEEFIVKIYPSRRFKDHAFSISTTSDYEVIDSIFLINEDYYQTKVRFRRILDNPRLSLKVHAKREDGRTFIFEQPLFPIAIMEVDFVSIPDDTFVGEETTVHLFSNLPENVKLSSRWHTSGNINYRVIQRRNELSVVLIATRTGRQSSEILLELKRPIRNEEGKLTSMYGPLPISLNVKGSRLAFLNMEQKEIIYDEKNREQGVEVQIDYHSGLKMETTYRIEAQEEAGGALIAELFTKNRLANNKVLCVLRTYNYHNQSEGFLYLKEGDRSRFITNFSVIPHTNIEKIKIMREDGVWRETTVVNPGEDVLIRFEGKSLQRASFSIEDLIIEKGDTLINRDDVIEYNATVPLNVRRRNLQILNNNVPTGKSLRVREHSHFRPFDYIIIDYGAGHKFIDDITGPEFFGSTIRDIVITFDHDKIDDEILHGIQSFDLNVRITGSRGEVFETLSLRNNKIVPGALSPRFAFYDRSNAVNRISLNQYLRRKTFDLDDWVKIQLEFRPSDESKTGRQDVKTIDIVVQKDFRFDIDVSFPAGLITKKFDGESGYGNLSGISMAMIAQFSFYQKDKIARFKPYKIGAGFIAINALNFSETAYRDMGVVVIASLLPTTRDNRMTFPLYFGGGYLLNDAEWFVLIGPGIRVRF